MSDRLVVTAVIGAVFVASGCVEPAPTELPSVGTPSLAATPQKSVSITGVLDLSGPIPGLPNVINPECISADVETATADFKKCIVLGSSTGDLVGDARAELNGRQDLATLASRAHGHFTLDVCHADVGCGAFEGPFKSTAGPGGQSTITGEGHGTGDFHTLQLRLTAVERGNTSIYDLSGVIF